MNLMKSSIKSTYTLFVKITKTKEVIIKPYEYVRSKFLKYLKSETLIHINAESVTIDPKTAITLSFFRILSSLSLNAGYCRV